MAAPHSAHLPCELMLTHASVTYMCRLGQERIHVVSARPLLHVTKPYGTRVCWNMCAVKHNHAICNYLLVNRKLWGRPVVQSQKQHYMQGENGTLLVGLVMDPMFDCRRNVAARVQ
ncbi:unnamed protein product [Prorocentrum cordatum]|uniref:Uncharacterized protein n=1 Tax=Prorocentrum cordatum TaxID=2364126 RepID=A0ABN9UXV2_9DINO|nr:unnamed protein product [Polarella glacialis]